MSCVTNKYLLNSKFTMFYLVMVDFVLFVLYCHFGQLITLV